MVEPQMGEVDKEDQQRKGSSAAGMVAPLQAPELVEVGPVWAGLFLGQGAQEEGRGLPTSEKAWGKAPTVEPPPPEINEELVRWLQQEEEEAEQVRRGQDAATLAVVREAAGSLI